MTSRASRLCTVMSTAVMNRFAWLRNTLLATSCDASSACWNLQKTACACGSSSKMRMNTRTPRLTLWHCSEAAAAIFPSLDADVVGFCCNCAHVFRIICFSSPLNRLWQSSKSGDRLRGGGEALNLIAGHLSNGACCEATFPIVRQQPNAHDVSVLSRFDLALLTSASH